MKSNLTIFSILIFLCAGCSSHTNRLSLNKSENKDIINSKDSGEIYSSEKQLNNTNFYDFLTNNNKIIMACEEPCKIRYHKSNSTYRNIVIEGSLGGNENNYPVILDTGASQPVVLNASVVRKNNLPIYSFEDFKQETNGHTIGFCQLSRLNIGNVSLEGWPCIYFDSSNGLNLFGVQVASSKYIRDNIILGLPLLREFKYITFDNINKETELSYYQSFEPEHPEQWTKYPISIEEDFHGNAFLFVRINIAGKEIELQLDTGSGKGLAIGESLWDEIKDNLIETKLKKGKDFYPYIGSLSCKKGKSLMLSFGNRTVYNAEISVFRDDCPLLDGCEGLVGMQYFSNTTFVLDFEHDLMWIQQ